MRISDWSLDVCSSDLVGAEIADRQIVDLPDLLAPGDLIVFNDTRVIPARLFGRKSTGGRVEVFVERVLGAQEFLAQLGVSKTPKAGGIIEIGDDRLTVLRSEEHTSELQSLMRISYAVFCLKKKKYKKYSHNIILKVVDL